MRRLMPAALLSLGLVLSVAPAVSHAQDIGTVASITKPAPGTPILIVMPEVSLGLLTAGGSIDPKQEWSDNARKYLDDSLISAMKGRGYDTDSIDATTYEDPRALQMLKLNDVVTDSIMLNRYFIKLPTKTTFDWTLGEDASVLVPGDDATPPAYALFIRVKGSYASSGRAAMMIGMAALGVGMTLGGQSVTASLVDLKTGQVVWYQSGPITSGVDIRTPAGATTAVATLLKKLPI